MENMFNEEGGYNHDVHFLVMSHFKVVCDFLHTYVHILEWRVIACKVVNDK